MKLESTDLFVTLVIFCPVDGNGSLKTVELVIVWFATKVAVTLASDVRVSLTSCLACLFAGSVLK